MPDMPQPYQDVYYRSGLDTMGAGRLALYARDYTPQASRAVICLHGLTRNSADFEPLMAQLPPTHRFVVPDVRGRGRSQRDEAAANYTLGIYVQDVLALMTHLNIERATFIGTSMGGLISMVLAAMAPPRVRGIVLNDVGPKLSPEGLERIRSYVGKGKPATTWAEAAEATARINAAAFPDFGPEDWMAFARRTHVEIDGRPVAAYDTAIAEGMAPASEAVAPPELWELWAGLKDLPVLAIRGGLSDLLSAQTLERMVREHPQTRSLTLPNRGHAPILDEPEAVTAIRAFLHDQDALD
ncbi:alpha/beta fold hydrolase [Asticcacaulis sp. AND118]|uniref:alpha/beta fold hydrolase n=1 Tax=Asticcacaulis sp. AND118 TaxID=2840468 RepID=UPI001CFF9095|nr:alpha/beta hydrolase [Asticcacaulis sp. AND118]UDF05551.1 alpha/beta hydrolase [Asticcacaulis sp. AND118]